MPIEANKNSLLWLLERLEETKKVEQNYKDKLKEIFYDLFQVELCTIAYAGEGKINVKLHLSELTQDDALKLNEIADLYTIIPEDETCFFLEIFSFKGVDE